MGQHSGLIRAATLLPPLVAFPLIWWTLRMTFYKWARLRMRIKRRNRKKKAADWVDFGSDDKERGTRKRLKRPRWGGLENEPGLLRYWPFFFIYLPDSLKQPSLNTPAFPSLCVLRHPFLILLAPPAKSFLFFPAFFSLSLPSLTNYVELNSALKSQLWLIPSSGSRPWAIRRRAGLAYLIDPTRGSNRTDRRREQCCHINTQSLPSGLLL